MAVPEIAGISLTNPYVIGGVIVAVVVIIGGVLWWLHKEEKI